MSAPESLWQQRYVRSRGELWRGSGVWPTCWSNGRLEPPFEPFSLDTITRWDLCFQGYDAPYQGEFGDRLKRWFFPLPLPSDESYSGHWPDDGEPWIVTVSNYADDEVTYAKAEHLLLTLGSLARPIAFELFGIGQSTHPGAGTARIEPRFIVQPPDVAFLEAQLHTLYPRAAVIARPFEPEGADLEWYQRTCGSDWQRYPLFAAPLCLAGPYCHPIRTFSRFDEDPLGPALAVLDELKDNEWAVLQILCCRALNPWGENLRLACEDPFRPGKMIFEEIDAKLVDDKLRSPLYAVCVHLAANTKRTLRNLSAFIHQFHSSDNRLIVRESSVWQQQWTDNPFPGEVLWRSTIGAREALTPGMLLNVKELTGLLHLPNPALPCERLLRVKVRTRQSPEPNQADAAVIIGENVHRGKVRRVALAPEARLRHCYLAGASGAGKSTLLLNMIVQDIAAGRGVGLLDPHGDLVKSVLRHIPQHRLDDVILFDAADTEYPFALNILAAQDDAERERIVAETVMALERYFPASWGPRLERILQYTLRTVLHAIPDATLADVELMLTDPEHRAVVLARTTDPRMLQFWNTQFKFFPKNATDPVLNKLSVFLLDRRVRNIICQRRSAIDFDQLLNDGKILLANLSTGLLTEKISGTLGSFLVTKIVNAAFRRAAVPESQRRPWYLYVDEFQSFMNLSVGFERILAESRKYKLVLAGLANQYIGQLSPGVRQAIFGNVGNLIVFRLGVEDAQAAAKELGVFTAEDVLNLEVGQAIARLGVASTAFNLQTYRESEASPRDLSSQVIDLARRRYAKPRKEVEKEISLAVKAAEQLEQAANWSEELSDPDEEDLVH